MVVKTMLAFYLFSLPLCTQSSRIVGEAASERIPRSAQIVHDWGEKAQPTKPTVRMRRVNALDLGSFGKTYPIREFPADKLIENKINSVNKDERIRLENQFLEITKSKISRPTATQLPVVTKNNSRLFNPAVYFENSVKDHQQKEVIKAGQHVNPLDFVSLTTPLVFFDSDDSIQKEWVKSHFKDAILILVNGDPLKVQEEFQKKVYFDQHGKFITRFSLKAVPSVITQDGKFLRIQECVPS